MTEQRNPVIGEKVRLNNGCLGQVIAIHSVLKDGAVIVTYHVRFLEALLGSTNCTRDGFTFPVVE